MADGRKPETVGNAVKDAVDRAMDAIDVFQTDPEYTAREEAWEERDKRDKRSYHLRKSGVLRVLPDEDADRIINATYDASYKCWAAVDAWNRTRLPFLFLLGTVGRGKTYASAIALALRGGMYFRARWLEQVFAANFGESVRRQESAFTSRLLVVDDIGTERNSESMAQALADIIDARQGGGSKTIVVANLTKRQLEERYFDERTLSRLSRIAKYIGDDGDDMRRR